MQTPYTIDELYSRAKKEIDIASPRLRHDLREDAIQEYVIAATFCVDKHDSNKHTGIRSFQQRCGKNKMLDFLKYENKRKMVRLDDIKID